jgi:glutathione S-transferase
MKISLIYFDFPFWRAEIARLSLFIGNIEFEDVRITSDEFQRVKSDGQLDNGIKIPFNQLPCLVVDKVSIAQTAGIARFCGKLANLYPQNNNIEAAKIDQFIDIATDLTVLVSSTKVEDRKNLVIGELARKLSILNKSIELSNGYLVGNTISIADIAIWRLMGWITSGSLDGIPLDVLKDHNNISKICLLVDKHPKVNEWIDKTYPKNYIRGHF